MGTKSIKEDNAVRETVRRGYAKIAGASLPQSGCCGKASADDAAQAMGYAETELKDLPEGANMGLSCGNPTAVASLQPGEVVLDLGSGGGFDVFIAGRKVGRAGRVIGVDMTPEMLDKARNNTAAYRQSTGLDNVEFRLGEIEHLPLPDGSVDVVISNCVINLSPDKPQVWREMARVLRPGGRVAVSDLSLRKPLPPVIGQMVEALVGCVAGAVSIDDTLRMAREAGLEAVEVEEKSGFVESMTDWNDPLFRKIIDHLPDGAQPGDYIVSAYFRATKPRA